MTSLGLGCAQLGNLHIEVTDEDATAIVDAAWAAGVRFFDTAPHYGLGLSERRLGAALAGRPRGECTVSSKVGRVLEPVDGSGRDTDFLVPATHERVWDFSRAGVRRSVEESLARLNLDRLDVALIHDAQHRADEAIGEAFPALVELRAEGVVGAIGTGSADVPYLTRFVRECEPDTVLVAGRYTLLEQPALAELLPACEAAGTSVVNGGVFNSGLLAHERPHTGLTYDYRAAAPDLVERAAAIADVCARHGTTLPAAAIAFAAGHPAVSTVLVGADSADQVRRNAELFASAPPPSVWSALVEAGLIATVPA
ncbi:aldo/keto reductase [Virgisporangium ochraceum]|uniref:Oxidoreductase n=1 Tax=Virgisporangium ochraceum TaxID=65505 RepID=A0A8J3ZYA3_9ACTN|nr:aldo/keto reductase [Virgisporangium ochraceum]GIJ71851.1 oxidoreductase [Virgisporangium ochraceum]